MYKFFNGLGGLSIFTNKINRYNPYINYSWSQTLTVKGNQQIKDSGTAGLNLQQFFGQGCWFNGIDMQVTIPINATIQTEIKRVNGVVEINTNTQNLTNYNVYSGSGAKVYKDLYMFNRALTPTEIEKYSNQPNQFFMDSLEDDSCILAMPMCEKNNLVRNYKNNTDYPITNYLTTCRTNAQRLPYGLQTSGFKRDNLGRILSKSIFLEADGVGYGNTGYISPLKVVPESFEVIIEKPKVLQSSFNKYVCGGASSSDMVVEISSNSDTNGYVRLRKVGRIFGSAQWLPTNKMLITLVCDGTKVYMYFNAVLSGTYVAQPYTVSNPIKFMAEHSINGNLVENRGMNQAGLRLFKVHQKALTQEEITQNFNKYQAQGLLNA